MQLQGQPKLVADRFLRKALVSAKASRTTLNWIQFTVDGLDEWPWRWQTANFSTPLNVRGGTRLFLQYGCQYFKEVFKHDESCASINLRANELGCSYAGVRRYSQHCARLQGWKNHEIGQFTHETQKTYLKLKPFSRGTICNSTTYRAAEGAQYRLSRSLTCDAYKEPAFSPKKTVSFTHAFTSSADLGTSYLSAYPSSGYWMLLLAMEGRA